jgi:hypothetical protein
VCVRSRVIVSLFLSFFIFSCRNLPQTIFFLSLFLFLFLSSMLISCTYNYLSISLSGLLFDARNRGAIEVLLALHPCLPEFFSFFPCLLLVSLLAVVLFTQQCNHQTHTYTHAQAKRSVSHLHYSTICRVTVYIVTNTHTLSLYSCSQ